MKPSVEMGRFAPIFLNYSRAHRVKSPQIEDDFSNRIKANIKLRSKRLHLELGISYC